MNASEPEERAQKNATVANVRTMKTTLMIKKENMWAVHAKKVHVKKIIVNAIRAAKAVAAIASVLTAKI